MDRDQMSEGMEVEHRRGPHEKWCLGVIVKIDEVSCYPVEINTGTRGLVLRDYHEIEPLGTAARKESGTR